MLAQGTLLQNRYRIITLLGQGGMGAVYQAQDLRLGQVVALKENLGGDPRQFQQEAVLLANLHHPNLPRVIDHFVEPNGAQYLVMDYVEGEDLESRLARQGALPEAQVLAWFDQILDAVAYLHSRGVIHRDIKPANIKVTPAGQAVLVDFGIAKVYQRGLPTPTPARAGTPCFAAPEQYRGGTDQRSDIYSLGATLYALLTGQSPPDAIALEGGSAILAQPRVLNYRISLQAEQAILRAMAILPLQRFQSIDEMRRALVAPVVLTAPTRQSPLPSVQPLPTTTHVQRDNVAVPILVAIVTCLILCGLLGLVTLFCPAIVLFQLPTPTRFATLPPTTRVSLPTSTLSGNVWTQVGLENEVVSAIRASSGGIVYAATMQYNHGVLKSSDRGLIWKAINNGLGDLNVYGLAVASTASDVIYASAGSWVYVSRDGGKTWALSLQRSVASPSVVLLSDDGSQAIVFTGYVGDSVCSKTQDFGKSWQPVKVSKVTISGDLSTLQMQGAPSNRKVIYAWMRSGAIYKSMDAGVSWQLAASVGKAYPVVALVVDSSDATIVYAGTAQSGLYKSTDGGGSWIPINNALPAQGQGLQTGSIAIDPSNPQKVYATFTGQGVFASADGGNTWMPLNAGLPSEVLSKKYSLASLVVSPDPPKYLYLGIQGRGVWRYNLP
jgi:photosystem II stability/assembly factor-like uncharacterized protein